MQLLLNVNAEEIRALNRLFGGTRQLNSTVETAFQGALYLDGFWAKVAMVSRNIAGGHLFDNGNKRTAFASARLFRIRNHVVTGTNDATLRETIRLIAVHELDDLDQIPRHLRGF